MWQKVHNHSFLLIILLAVIIRLIISALILYNAPDRVVQDDYHLYADALIAGTLDTQHFAESNLRLFPIYPVTIALVNPLFQSTIYAGIALSILFSLLVLFLAKYIFKDKLVLILLAIFPPMWIEQSVTVATEPLFAFLSIAALLLFLRKKLFLAGLLIGFAFMTRPVALTLLISLFLFLLWKKQSSQGVSMIVGFTLTASLLLLFNWVVFGPDELLQQFKHPDRYGELRLGFVQIVQDFYRTLDWKEYTTFFSGSFYVITNLVSLYMLAIHRRTSDLTRICFLWLLCTLLFILTFSPFKLLDDFGRYALAALPAYAYGITLLVRRFQTRSIFSNKSHRKDGI